MAKRDGSQRKIFGNCKVRQIIYLIFILAATSAIALAQNTTTIDTIKDIEPNWPIIINPLIDGILPEYEEAEIVRGEKVVNGFRVQVFSTNDALAAEITKARLISLFYEEVRVTFDAPNYKVRIGKFANRRQAEAFRLRLYNAGYRQAWIVRSRITIHQ